MLKGRLVQGSAPQAGCSRRGWPWSEQETSEMYGEGVGFPSHHWGKMQFPEKGNAPVVLCAQPAWLAEAVLVCSH